MRLISRLSIFWLILDLNSVLKFVESESNGVDAKVSSDKLGASKFNHLAIHRDNGTVFVGTVNGLYRLSHDLKFLAKAKTCKVSDPMNYNKILVIDYETPQLIICGASTKCPCSAYDFNRGLSSLVLTTLASEEISLGSGNASTVAFISQNYDNANSDGTQKLVVAVSNNRYSFNQPGISVRTMNPKNFLSVVHKNNNVGLETFQTAYHDDYRENYVYGFNSGKNNYFLSTQHSYKKERPAYVSKLIRVCDNGKSLLQGYSEIPIECTFHNNQPYNLVQAATAGKPNSQLAKSLNIGTNDTVLFAIFSKSRTVEGTDNEPINDSALCIYSLKELDEKFTENIKNCFEGNRRQGSELLILYPQCTRKDEKIDSNFCASVWNMPVDGDQPIIKSPVVTFNVRITAIASKRNQNDNDVFIGTNTGHLKNIKLIDSTTACELIDLPIDEGSPVNSDLLFSPKNDSLYVMTEHNLSKIKIPITLEDCSKNKNFSTCMQSITHYCGWCELNNKCTTKCECLNDNYSSWYSHDFRNKIKIADNYDKSLINPGEKLEFKITNLPSIKDNFHCAFFFKKRTIPTIATLHKLPVGFTVFCSAPELHDILKMPRITDNLNTSLSLRAENNGDMALTRVTFSRCFTFTSCDICVSMDRRCQWNYTKKECFYSQKGIIYDPTIITQAKFCERCKETNITAQRSSSPSISSFWPLKGPVEGGTNITIQGKNLIYKFQDINKTIKVAGVPCTPHEDMFVYMEMFICEIEKTNVTHVHDHEGPVEVQINGTSLVSAQKFKFVNPKIMYINPSEGPVYGGTSVEIVGEYLNAGRAIDAFIGKSCAVYSRNSAVIRCITNASTEKEAEVFVKFDESTRYLSNGSFRFVKDPLRDENGYNNEPKGILSGGVEILIRNVDPPPRGQSFLRILSEKTIYNVSCKIMNNSKTWTCLSPFITDIDSNSLNAEKPREMNISFGYFDSNEFYFNKPHSPRKFRLYPDPKFDYFFTSSVECGEDIFIIIMGRDINKACQKTDITVTVANHTCEVMTISSNQVICRLPELFLSHSAYNSEKICNDVMEFSEIIVSIGDNFKVIVHKQQISSLENKTNYYVYIICGVIIFILLVILATHYLISKRIITKSFKKLKNTQKKMNNLELCVASECKEAFAELQTQVTIFNTNNSCTALPFLKYHTYIMNILFPNIQDNSIILLNGKTILTQKEKGIQLFRRLIMNRNFLLSFVRTLERDQNFSMNDRVYVASVLMITLQKDMEYCTEILQTLLAELIEKNMRNGSHPKLLLRRTESIVEKMLSAWFSFLLYKFLKETAGQPLFNLFNAIKEHINRGPADMITSQARYCLSENKMLRHKIVFFPLTIYVSISQRTSDIFEFESPVEKVPVEVLDCDTISQFKEKALDAISRKFKFIRIIDPTELNVEWVCDSTNKLILYDDDASSVIEGEWRRKNTLKHYKVPNGGALNLISHEEKSSSFSAFPTNFNLKTPLIENKCEPASLLHRMQKKSLTDPTTALIQSSDLHYKEWHLVKPHDVQDEQKDHNGSDQIIPEIFLTRLLGVKSSLQKFIDELFAIIFNNTNQDNSVPMAIKYMFDFLDDQAFLHNITDPEVVHVWKNNCVPLRFWVNLIKNPNFLFDVRKSNIVDSCLSVIAQVFMDSCSTSEQHLNKDSATTKLLFAKEIHVYNQMVVKYYAGIKNTPKITSEDMNAMLEEESKTCNTDFDTNASVYELFKFAVKYKEKLIDALKNDEFSKQNALVFEFEESIKIMSDIQYLSDE